MLTGIIYALPVELSLPMVTVVCALIAPGAVSSVSAANKKNRCFFITI